MVPLRDRDAPPILFRLGEKECAAPGGKEKRLVPKSCLAAGLGKDGGFSKKAPDICCLVYALGAGTRFAETSSGQPATKRRNLSGVRIELALLLFSLPLRRWLTTVGWITTSLLSPGVKSRIGGRSPLVWSVRKGCGGAQSKGFPRGLFWTGRGPFSLSEKMGGASPRPPCQGGLKSPAAH